MQTPAIIKPVELWTGKQVVSMLLRPTLSCPIFINIQLKEKGYTSGEHFCPKDGFVSIVNSDLICGRIGKGLLGGNKAGLFSVLAARYSPAVAGVGLARLTVIELLHKVASWNGFGPCPFEGVVSIRTTGLGCGRTGKAILSGRRAVLFGVLVTRLSPAVAGVLSMGVGLTLDHLRNSERKSFQQFYQFVLKW
jgi:hypothetical protein